MAADDEPTMVLTKKNQSQFDEEENRRLRDKDDKNAKMQDASDKKYGKGAYAKQGAIQAIQPAPADETLKNPEARAKARAKQSYFADAGRPITPGKEGNDRFQTRFKGGKFNKLTLDQANEKFEQEWAKAGPELREKYAKMADPAAGLAPSEKAAQLKAQREKEAKENPVPQKPQVGPSFEELTEEKSQAFNATPVSGTDANGQTNAIGDGSTTDGKYTGFKKTPFDTLMGKVGGGIASGAKAVGRAIMAGPMPANMQSPSRATPAAPVVQSAPVVTKPSFVGPPAPASATVRGDTPRRSADIAAAGGDMSKLSTDNRMFAQGNTNAGGAEAVVKAPTATPFATPEMAGPPASANPRSAIGQRADAAGLTRGSELKDRMAVFAPKQGEELIGMKRGVPQYAPKSAPVTATPAMLSEADSALREQGIQKPTAPRALPMRGPASQPEAVTAPRTIVKPNMDVMKQHADAMERQNAPGATGAYGAEANKIFNSADVNTRNAIGGQVALRAQAIDKPKPVVPVRPMFARR